MLFMLVMLVAAALGYYFIWQYYLQRKAKFAHYDAFGIDIPVNYTIHGIDVSNYQENIYWDTVKAMKVGDIRLGFVFIKATEGLDDVDPKFSRNWKFAAQDSIVKGAYHFFLSTKSGKAQALHFIKQVDLRKGDLPPVVDIEELYGVPLATMRKRLKECLQTLENYYRVKPIIYSYVDFYEKNLGKEFDAYPLWIAHYFEKEKPRIERSWLFWQHSDRGHVNGITSPVDFNVFKGDTAAFMNMLIK